VKATLTGPALSFTIHSAGVLVEIDGAQTPVPTPDDPTPQPATGYDLNTSAALLEAFNNKLDPLGTPDMAKLGPFGQPGTWTIVEAGFTRSNSCYRWSAALVAPVDGEYEFTFWVKSGGSIWFDGELVWSLDREEDALSTATGNTVTFKRTLTKGRAYPLKAHVGYQGFYYGLTLNWKRPDREAAESVSTAYLHPPADWQSRLKDYAPPPPEPSPFIVPDASYQSPAITGDLYPASSPWRTPIDQAPVDPLSDAIIARLGTAHVHPVFGPGVGIPFENVPAGTPMSAVTFDYAAESDPGPYPLTTRPVVESGGGDGHWIGVTEDRIYELFYVSKPAGWHAGSGAIFDRATGERISGRNPGWTSADAAGLSILHGLVRPDETEINHALRISVPKTRRAYVYPATHFASTLTDADLPPMGCRLRLKASVDESTFPPQCRPIIRAAKRYGFIVADNGGPFLGLCGVPDARWDDTELAALKTIKADSFEVIEMGPITESN
jgi:hypothetical protein